MVLRVARLEAVVLAVHRVVVGAVAPRIALLQISTTENEVDDHVNSHWKYRGDQFVAERDGVGTAGWRSEWSAGFNVGRCGQDARSV
jgi:hypothetical protein